MRDCPADRHVAFHEKVAEYNAAGSAAAQTIAFDVRPGSPLLRVLVEVLFQANPGSNALTIDGANKWSCVELAENKDGSLCPYGANIFTDVSLPAGWELATLGEVFRFTNTHDRSAGNEQGSWWVKVTVSPGVAGLTKDQLERLYALVKLDIPKSPLQLA